MFREISKQLLTFDKSGSKTPPGDMNHTVHATSDSLTVIDSSYDFGLNESGRCRHGIANCPCILKLFIFKNLN